MPPGESSPQNRDERTAPDQGEEGEQRYEDQVESGEEPDVLLDVPVLKVEELKLELEDLRAHVSLRANLADVVNVNVGVDAYLDKVKLEVKGLEAQVLLKVGLDRVLDTFNRALEVIDQNPEIVGRSRGSQAPEDTEDPAENPSQRAEASEKLAPNTTVLGESVGQDGGTVVRSVNEFGELLETALDGSGSVTDEKILGRVEDLAVEKEYLDDEGRTVNRVRDELGNAVERTLDERGNTLGLSVPETPDDSPAIEITATAERKARELGVDLASVEGTGSGGRIVVKDIEKAYREQT